MFNVIVCSVSMLVILCGCATARKTYTSTGKEGYSINCSGGATTWGRCYEKAGDVCGARGYEVLEKIGENLSSSSGNLFEQHSGTDVNRNMIIRCRD